MPTDKSPNTNNRPQHGKAILSAAGQSAEVDATYDPTTGVTDLDPTSLASAFAQLEPGIEQQRREDEAFLQAFTELAESDGEITGIGQLFTKIEERTSQLLDDDGQD